MHHVCAAHNPRGRRQGRQISAPAPDEYELHVG